jgi:hypothetical protein
MGALIATKRVFASLLAGLALAMPLAHADFRGKVQALVNPEAPRAEWRRVPLPGAYIAMSWSVTVPAPAHAVTTCRYSEFARSDEKGEYVMEGPNFVTAALATSSFLVYAPGMQQINFPYPGSLQSATDITMVRSTLTPAGRLSRIVGYIDPHCPDTKLNDPHGLLGAYYRSLLEEASSLNVETPEGRRNLQSIQTAARRASGLDIPGPIRAVVRPSAGSIQSASPPPGQ